MNTKKIPECEINAVTQYPDYKTEIAEILKSNLTPKLIKDQISRYHENDIASALELLKADERKKLYNILDTQTLSSILEYSGKLSEYIGELSIKKRVSILSDLEISTAVKYLSDMERSERNMLLELMDDQLRYSITMLSSFDEDEIGSKMTTNFISVKNGTSIRDAMRELIRQAADNDNIATIYVTDDEDTFVGAIDLKDLIIARESTQLDAITKTSYPYVYTSELIEDCIERIKEYSEDSIPVLDSQNKLRGVLTSQDILELADDEMSDDYAKLAALSSEEDLYEPFYKSIKKRLPWLITLLFLGLIVSGVVNLFEGVVSHLTVIVSFQSLILGMAGNAGTQSLAVTIRVLANEEISGKQKLHLIIKEARIGIINGILLALLSFFLIGSYLSILKDYTAVYAFSVSLCTAIALIITILLSSICGTVIPLTFKKMKIDPAVASGPLITTVNDLVAVISYYGLAWLLLINILSL